MGPDEKEGCEQDGRNTLGTPVYPRVLRTKPQILPEYRQFAYSALSMSETHNKSD